jgi:hypothetical protein
MPPEPERVSRGLFVRYALFVVVLGLIATASFIGADPADRPLVLRLAVAAFVVVVAIHLHSHFRGHLDEARPSAFDEAQRGPAVEAKVATAVTRLQEHVQHGSDSQRYFNDVLWPRLERLTGGRGIAARFQALREERRWRRRGPSVPAIAELVRHIGDRK